MNKTIEIKTTRYVRSFTYYAGPESDNYLAVDLGRIQVFGDEGFQEGDEVEIQITIKKKK